jgi:hypothetical protein
MLFYGPDNFRFTRNHFKNPFPNFFGKDMEIGDNTTDAQPMHVKENMSGQWQALDRNNWFWQVRKQTTEPFPLPGHQNEPPALY